MTKIPDTNIDLINYSVELKRNIEFTESWIKDHITNLPFEVVNILSFGVTSANERINDISRLDL